MEHGPNAVTKLDTAKLDPAVQPLGMNGLNGFRHARRAIEDGENPLSAGPGPLHGHDDAADAVHPAVESGNIDYKEI